MNKSLKTYLAYGLVASLFVPVTVLADTAIPTSVPVEVQQAKSIKGNVVDENGEPMIGVSIKIVGANVGGITDIEGNFSVNNAEGKQLQFSYAGYKTLTLAASPDMRVKMEPDMQGLDEVVVIGFGTVKKRDLTGSVAQIKSEAILQTPTSDVATALQGRITGLDVSGDEMRIRGNRSISGSNEPLVIIDGVQGGSLSDINPDDVESIDVLKDASSTAIYGSQGANGVIIVTTKKAEAGRFLVSYNGDVTAAFREQHPDYRSGQNYYDARMLAAKNAGSWTSSADDLAAIFGGSPEAYAAYQAGAWTNYEDLLQKSTTWSTRHTVTLSGGNERTQARFSVGYANNGSKWKESGGNDRYTLRANIDHNIREWINGGVTFQLTHNRAEHSPYEEASTTDMQLGSPYGYYDYNSQKYVIGNELVERPLDAGGYVNPLINTFGDDRYKRETYGTNVVANGYLDIHPIDGLSLRTQFNAHITNSSDGRFTAGNAATQTYNGTNETTAYEIKANSLYTEWNNILTYQFKMLPEEHHLSATALTSWNKRKYDNLDATSKGQTLASNLWWNLASNDGGAGHMTHTSYYEQEQSFSYAFRINYDWMSRYLFTASVRRDGASRLAEGHKWETFPSAAVAWRVSDEPFMKSTKSWLDDLKIRATYGVTGNSGVPVYGTASGVKFYNTKLGFQDTSVGRYELGVPDGSNYIIGNKDTKWEMSYTWDIGFDAMLFNNRLSITFDWYNTKTKDLIMARNLPTTSGNDGAFQTYTNIGSTRNRGWELTVNSRNIVTRDFQWNSTLSLSANSEKILELYEGKERITMGNSTPESTTLQVGHPVHSYYTFDYLGIWQTSEAAQAAQLFTDANKTKPFQPGDIKVSDINEDGWIDQSTDYTYVGSQTPKWFAGFNNDFRYKDFDLNIYLYARWGHWGDNPLANFQPGTGGKYTTMDYWVAGSNEGGSFPALMQNYNFYDYKGYTAYWYCEQSFIRLKRISLGYTLPRTVTRRLGIEMLRVYATVNNPFCYVKNDWMKHFDPEGQQRSITFGLNVNF